MKKTTIETMISYLNGNAIDIDALRNDLTAELTKLNEKAAKNADLYAVAGDVVLAAMTDEPLTCAEIYEKVKDELPEGFSRSKVQYGLLNMWADRIVKHIMPKGAANTYSLAA